MKEYPTIYYVRNFWKNLTKKGDERMVWIVGGLIVIGGVLINPSTVH